MLVKNVLRNIEEHHKRRNHTSSRNLKKWQTKLNRLRKNQAGKTKKKHRIALQKKKVRKRQESTDMENVSSGETCIDDYVSCGEYYFETELN